MKTNEPVDWLDEDKSFEELIRIVISDPRDEDWTDRQIKALCLIHEQKLQSQKAELIKEIREQLRGEDVDQYRPSDMVSMEYVEEILDDFLAKIERNSEI